MTIKEQVHQLANELPEGATWDDVFYEIYARRQVALGMQDVDEGRTVSDEDARREFFK
ncbi:MAG: hypothetical protein ACRD2K_02070 [Terriglobales bacterium]